MLKASHINNTGYRFDVINVGRQVLGNLFSVFQLSVPTNIGRAFIKTACPAVAYFLYIFLCNESHAFRWCYLGNFGGNSMMVGNLDDVDVKIEKLFVEGGENVNGYSHAWSNTNSYIKGFTSKPSKVAPRPYTFSPPSTKC